jgi:hypothetical protein
MGVLRDRLVQNDGQASLRSSGMAVSEIIGRLAGGDAPNSLIAPGALTAADLVAALAQSALGHDGELGPSLVQTKPRDSALLRPLSEPAWVAVFPAAPHRARLCLSAGLLQIHDFWDKSHDAAQRADDQGERDHSAYWHGIAHRREPDSGNSAYWFRRVGKHAIFKRLADAAHPLIDEHGHSQLSGRLIPGGGWNPMAMIDLCTQAPSGTAQEILARRLQRLEMWLLLEATYAAIAT